MVEAITASIDSLVRTVENDVVYEDLDGLQVYLKWTIDHAKYEEDMKLFKVALREEGDPSTKRYRVFLKEEWEVGGGGTLGMEPILAHTL